MKYTFKVGFLPFVFVFILNSFLGDYFKKMFVSPQEDFPILFYSERYLILTLIYLFLYRFRWKKRKWIRDSWFLNSWFLSVVFGAFIWAIPLGRINVFPFINEGNINSFLGFFIAHLIFDPWVERSATPGGEPYRSTQSNNFNFNSYHNNYEESEKERLERESDSLRLTGADRAYVDAIDNQLGRTLVERDFEDNRTGYKG